MKEMNRNILDENPQLRKQAYSVPDGYFEAFKSQMTPHQQMQQSWTGRLIPYISMAAAFLLLVTAGTFFLQKFTPAEDFTQEDYLVFSHNVITAEYYESMDQIADAEIAAEDIIEYLIYSGITPEEIEIFK